MESAFRLHWHHEKYIICEVDRWESWRQIDTSFEQYRAMIKCTSKAPVHLIYVFHDVDVPQPWSIKQIYTFMSMPKDPRQITFMVNPPRILKLVMGMAHQVYGLWEREQEYIYVATLKKALEQISLLESDNVTTLVDATK